MFAEMYEEMSTLNVPEDTPAMLVRVPTVNMAPPTPLAPARTRNWSVARTPAAVR